MWPASACGKYSAWLGINGGSIDVVASAGEAAAVSIPAMFVAVSMAIFSGFAWLYSASPAIAANLRANLQMTQT